MNIKVATKTDTEISFEIKLNKEDLAPTVRGVFNRLRQNIKAHGFRPGKAPDNVVEREAGPQHVQAEVIEAAAQAAYIKAMKEQNATPVEAPKVELAKFVPYSELEMKLTVEVLPPIKLTDYKKLKKQPTKVVVTTKEIEQVIAGLRLRAASRQDVKRAAKTGDEVVIDFEGKRKGEVVPDASSKEYPIVIGSGRLVPGFEENLVGLREGITKAFDVTFPKDYFDQALQGEKLTFSVKVHKVKEVVQPKLDDDFAKKVGPFESLGQLKVDVKKQITLEKEQDSRKKFENDLVGELVTKSKMALPPRMLARELEHLKNDLVQQLQHSGTNLEEHLKSQKKTLANLDKELSPTAERRVKTALILSEVAKQEGLSVTPEELEIRKQLIKGQYQDSKMQEQLDSDQAKRDIANQILLEKTVAKLTEYATK